MSNIVKIDLLEIDGFKNHPFSVKNDSSLNELLESIKTNGLLNPIIVRKKKDGRYEIISGHRRKYVYELLERLGLLDKFEIKVQNSIFTGFSDNEKKAGLELLDYLISNNVNFKLNFFNKEVVKYLFERNYLKALPNYISLSNLIETDILTDFIKGIKNGEINRNISEISYSFEDVSLQEQFLIELAKEDMLKHIDILEEKDILKVKNDKMLIEELLDLDQEMAMKVIGKNEKNAKIAAKVDAIMASQPPEKTNEDIEALLAADLETKKKELQEVIGLVDIDEETLDSILSSMYKTEQFREYYERVTRNELKDKLIKSEYTVYTDISDVFDAIYQGRFQADEVKSEAITKEKDVHGLIIHSDQGFQYTSYEYKAICESNGIQISMSRKGSPIDDSPIESWHALLKKETLYNNNITSLQEYIQLVEDWILFYNTIRLKSKNKKQN